MADEAPQPAFVLADLDETRRHLAEQLDSEEYERCIRAGARRTRTEVIDIATRALEAFLDAHDEQVGDPNQLTRR